MESNIPSPSPTIAQLTTPILVGVLLDYFLFGVLTLQLYFYTCSFPYDRLGTRLLVYSVYALELAQVCCCGADIYYWFGAGFGDLKRLDNTYISPFDTPMLGSLVALIVQLFFCYRIWKLRDSDWYIAICVVIVLISFLQLVGGVGGGANAHIKIHFSAVIDSVTYAYIWLLGEAAADVIIAVTMTYLLLGSDSERQSRNNGIASQVIRLLVQSNSLTASTAVISVVLFAGLPGQRYFVTPTIVLGKLYSNALLATFNHRAFLRQSYYDTKASYLDFSGHSASNYAPAHRTRGFSETVTENRTYGPPPRAS